MEANRPVAHTPPKGKKEPWHYLDEHLGQVAKEAKTFAETFDAGELAYVAGLFHDIGKAGAPFQDYLQNAYKFPNLVQKKVDHSSAGALLARALYEETYDDLIASQSKGSELAWVIAAHHAGLANREGLEQRLLKKRNDEEIKTAVDLAIEGIPELHQALGMSAPILYDFPNPKARELFIRMLLSTLVDADHLDTEKHRNPDKHLKRERDFATIPELLTKVISNQQEKQEKSEPSPVNQARRDIYGAALHKAKAEQGFFRLTVPTGGGKTRTSLAFALQHAKQHGLRRVVYAIPYTSITTQTADEFRSILGDEDILEHHSSYSPHDEETETWSKLAYENWDSPVVVTTTVQLFESLFSNRPSNVRKIHRLAKSVIVLDEVQTLPAPLLDPILDVLRELVRFYGVTVVLCTATQPALDESKAFKGLPNVREIAPEPEKYFRELARVNYDLQLGKSWEWQEVADSIMQEGDQVLCIVNTKKHARELFSLIREKDPNAIHLSTNMCAIHRREVLEQIKEKLKNKKPCRVIATQLIEAGIDLDFPVVYRAIGPLDSIVQAAGRCNREGRLEDEKGNKIKGRVVVFKPVDAGLPKGVYAVATQLAENLLKSNLDLHQPEIFKQYFSELYTKLTDTDAKKIQELREQFNFPEVATRFKLIEDNTVPVLIRIQRWNEVETILRETWRRDTLRRLQPYTINVYQNKIPALNKQALIRPLLDFEGIWEWVGKYDDKLGIVEEVEGQSFIF